MYNPLVLLCDGHLPQQRQSVKTSLTVRLPHFMCEKKWEDEGVNDLRWSAVLDVL